MDDEHKARAQLLDELSKLRARVDELQRADADRGLIESRLRESVQLYHGTIDAMEDIIHVVGRDLRVTLANTALRNRCEELGIPMNGVIGRNVFDLFPFLTDTVRREYEQVLATGEHLRTTERQVVSDREFLTETVKIPVLEEGVVARIVTVVRDVTAREVSRAALEESESKYRQLYEMESDAIFLVDQDTGQILEANSAASAMYGYSREELLASRNVDLSAEPDETRKATEARKSSVPVRYHRKKDGSSFPVEITASHFTWGGRDVHLAAIRDIGDRKRAEEEMVRLERLRALGEMSAGVSHNLNNILTGIMGPAQLLLMDSGIESVKRDAEIICNSAIRARDLVRRLHQSVKGHEEELAEPVDISVIAAEAVRTTQPRWKDESEAKGTPVVVKTRLTEGLAVSGASSSFHDVVVNLLMNAVDALPNGGDILVETQELKGDAVLRVSDTGVGMDSATRQRVFEPFFTTKPNVGTGLGLSTVYGTVTRWGGTVNVESTRGAGTTFTVRLPLWPTPYGHEGPESETPQEARPGRLLLVEDDAGVSEFLEGLLSEEHDVTLARDSCEGMARFEEGDFDVVLIDLGLPGMPGDRLAMNMRALKPDVVTVLITGWDLEDGDPRLSAFDLRVRKPFDDLRRLLRVVRHGVALRDARSQGT